MTNDHEEFIATDTQEMAGQIFDRVYNDVIAALSKRKGSVNYLENTIKKACKIVMDSDKPWFEEIQDEEFRRLLAREYALSRINLMYDEWVSAKRLKQLLKISDELFVAMKKSGLLFRNNRNEYPLSLTQKVIDSYAMTNLIDR